MKKKLIEILNVSKVLKDLTTKRFNNFSISYKIAKAAKLVDEQNSFYVEEERKIVEHYAVKDEETGQVKIIDGNRISFANQNDAMNFNKEINEFKEDNGKYVFIYIKCDMIRCRSLACTSRHFGTKK